MIKNKCKENKQLDVGVLATPNDLDAALHRVEQIVSRLVGGNTQVMSGNECVFIIGPSSRVVVNDANE